MPKCLPDGCMAVLAGWLLLNHEGKNNTKSIIAYLLLLRPLPAVLASALLVPDAGRHDLLHAVAAVLCFFWGGGVAVENGRIDLFISLAGSHDLHEHTHKVQSLIHLVALLEALPPLGPRQPQQRACCCSIVSYVSAWMSVCLSIYLSIYLQNTYK